jgi:hypothetical protein
MKWVLTLVSTQTRTNWLKSISCFSPLCTRMHWTQNLTKGDGWIGLQMSRFKIKTLNFYFSKGAYNMKFRLRNPFLLKEKFTNAHTSSLLCSLPGLNNSLSHQCKNCLHAPKLRKKLYDFFSLQKIHWCLTLFPQQTFDSSFE